MAGDISDALVSKLQIRMENPEGDKFTPTMCLKALDYAHLTTVNLLRPEYLAEFQAVDSANTMTANAIDISDLGNVPLQYNEGILMVQHDISGEYFQRVHPSRLRRYENTYITGDTTNRIYWVLGGKIITRGAAAETNDITVYILKRTVEMTTDVDPVLNSLYHNIILNFAEAELWTTNKTLERRKVKLEEAYAQIEALNAKYIVPLGIGVTNLNR